MSVGVQNMQIRLAEDGTDAVNAEIVLDFDVCPTWLGLSAQHLMEAASRKDERNSAWSHGDGDAKGTAFEREFESAMQAIVAVATAVEALYAAVRTKGTAAEPEPTAERSRRSPRFAVVAEGLRKAYRIKDENFEALRNNLKALYTLRNDAVHPASGMAQILKHPEIDVGIERRLAYFSYPVADTWVKCTAQTLLGLCTQGNGRTDEAKEYITGLRPKIEAVFANYPILAQSYLPNPFIAATPIPEAVVPLID